MMFSLPRDNSPCLRSLVGLCAIAVCLVTSIAWADDPAVKPMISADQLRQIIGEEMAKKQGFEPADLISQDDAENILNALNHYGWKVADAQDILDHLLPKDHIVVSTFKTQKGTRFMRKVDGYELIYDRLHRTAELPGGKALVRDIVKLPNGEIYAKMKPAPGNPNFTDLLPKGRNGLTPPPTNFDKPTGYIYTIAQLQQRLEASRQRDLEPAAPPTRNRGR